jgi:hypothetical protein
MPANRPADAADPSHCVAEHAMVQGGTVAGIAMSPDEAMAAGG